jgi:hypothetical protein
LTTLNPIAPDMLIEPKITGLRSEDRLLFCCARTTIEEESAGQIKDLLRHEIDWTYLIESAIDHRVVPLLYRSLRQILGCIKNKPNKG